MPPRSTSASWWKALGVKPERIHEVNPYELPTLFKALREEVKVEDTSVIITNQPCVLTDRYSHQPPYAVDAETLYRLLQLPGGRLSGHRRHQARDGHQAQWQREGTDLRRHRQRRLHRLLDLCPGTCGPEAIRPLAEFNRAGARV
jgi:indolepyruvate ferredoxin oxidoreductase alpha subunit